MRSGKVSALFFVMFLFAVSQGEVRGEEKQWVVLHDNISQECERFDIPLKFSSSSSTFYSGSTKKFKSKKIKEGCGKGKYTERLDFGTAVDGNEYSALVRDASDLNFISEIAGRLCEVKILRTSGKEEPVTVKEGYLFLQKDVNMKIKVCPEQIGIPSKEPVAVNFRMTINRSNPPVYDGSLRVSVTGRLSGSTATDDLLLGVSMTCQDSPGLTDRYVSLSVKPYDDQMSTATASGKISEVFMAGSAKLVVEKIASDGSGIVLALLRGDLLQKKANVEKPKSPLEVGKPFPNFARIELIDRRLLTLGDLKKEAGCKGYVALVFGDLKQSLPPQFSGMPQVKNLTLDEAMICEILNKDVEKAVVIGFACQEFSLSDLYEKWLDGDRGFYVFSDFSNPLNVHFSVAGMHRMHYGPPAKGETLRGQLVLPEDKVITALINGAGDLVYLNADAGKELAGSLVQMNKLVREEKTSEKEE